MSYDFTYPVIAFSIAGWVKEAASASDLTDASPNDDLAGWQGLVIYDASGHRYTARRTFRRWPRSNLGARLCRILGISIHVGFDLTNPEPTPLEELKSRVEGFYGRNPLFTAAADHRAVIELCL